MRKTKGPQKRTKTTSVKSAWVQEVWDYLERQRSDAEDEGNHASVRYLETCVRALLVCDQLGIALDAAPSTKSLRATRPS